MPALNEEEALPVLLDSLPDSVDRVVVVDNGSTDATARVAAERGAEVVVEPRRGYGSACLAGLAHLERGARPEVVVFLDADRAVDPAVFKAVAGPARRDEADLVVGVRAVEPGKGELLPVHQRGGNRVVLVVTRLLFGQVWRDIGPFRAVRTDALGRLAMDDRSWGWTLQMQIRAGVHGLRTLEVEVPHRGRTAGRSKITGSPWVSLRVGVKMFYTLLRERIRAAGVTPDPRRGRAG